MANGLGLLCINLNRAPLADAIELLGCFAPPIGSQPSELFANDWRERIGSEIDSWTRQAGVDRRHLTTTQRRELVSHLDQARLFETRHAVSHVANSLGLGRTTIYNALKNARTQARSDPAR